MYGGLPKRHFSDLFDSAVVIGSTLHVLHVTVTEWPALRFAKCLELITNLRRKRSTLRQVRFWMVVPKDSELAVPVLPQPGDPWRCQLHEVDMTSVDCIRASLRTLPFLVQTTATVVKNILDDLWVSWWS
jgi:hypothetical protein